MGPRVFLVGIGQARRALERDFLQERAAERGADLLDRRRAVAVALVAADAAGALEPALALGERRRVVLAAGDSEVGGKFLTCVVVNLHPLRSAERETGSGPAGEAAGGAVL